MQPLVTKIELDVENDQFIVYRPQRGLKFQETSIPIPYERLVMKSNMPKRDCLYYDAETGEGLATVNKGQWYN